jgi:ABC-2 type transport system permease protein
MSPRGAAISGGAATVALARLTWRLLWRGKAVWVSLVLAALPLIVAVLSQSRPQDLDDVVLPISILLLSILSPLYVASSLAEELEERTAAYLWSRPLPRWTIITGKLVAMVPMVAALLLGGTLAAAAAIGAIGTTLSIDHLFVGMPLGIVAYASCSAGIATIAPKHGMAVALVYFLFVDTPLSLIPASIRELSLQYHVRSLVDASGPYDTGSLIALVVFSVVWLAVALWRVRRLE